METSSRAPERSPRAPMQHSSLSQLSSCTLAGQSPPVSNRSIATSDFSTVEVPSSRRLPLLCSLEHLFFDKRWQEVSECYDQYSQRGLQRWALGGKPSPTTPLVSSSVKPGNFGGQLLLVFCMSWVVNVNLQPKLIYLCEISPGIALCQC